MHTGPRAFCLLMALAATGSEIASSADLAPDHYRVEAKLVGVSAADAQDFFASVPRSHSYSNEQVARLMGSAKSVLSLPSIDAGQPSPSKIALTQSISFAHAASREIGVTLDVVPIGKCRDQHLFSVSIKDVRFAGFADRSATKPAFSARNLSSSVGENPNYWCYCLPPVRGEHATYDADGRRSASVADANERQLLFVKITRG